MVPMLILILVSYFAVKRLIKGKDLEFTRWLMICVWLALVILLTRFCFTTDLGTNVYQALFILILSFMGWLWATVEQTAELTKQKLIKRSK